MLRWPFVGGDVLVRAESGVGKVQMKYVANYMRLPEPIGRVAFREDRPSSASDV